MENRLFYKKYLIGIIITLVLFIASIITIASIETNTYKQILNAKLLTVVKEIQKRDIDLSDKEILDILTSKSHQDVDTLKKYGYDIKSDDLVQELNSSKKTFIIAIICSTIGFGGIFIYLFIKSNNSLDAEIDKLIRLLEKINRREYDLDLDELNEDKFSILKNELYKTTIMLKEVAENSTKDKLNLKDSISDISHQLKTPLTSILIMLDDIIDDKDMDSTTREEFLSKIRREILNINFLVQALLKLSRLDADAVKFNPQKINVDDIINTSIKNVETLRELKNIKIVTNIETKNKISIDPLWQTEAITNILKNAIEHSKENAEVEIIVNENKLYMNIDIIDHGEGIKKEDIKHIFERFYRASSSSKDSIGIGLPLAKAIIEKESGKISVESKINEGTKFTIKYFF